MSKGKPDRVYELEVALIGGPITEEFYQHNPVISRTIQILGSQTLARLHDAIYKAFGRWDEHMFEFQIGGKRPNDRKALRFVMEEATDGLFGDEDHAGVVTETHLNDLGLRTRMKLFYWFDFGDDWWHQIKVLKIYEEADQGAYPRVVASTGKNPPQYPGMDDQEEEYADEDDDWDEEDEEDEDDEEDSES